MGELIRKRWYSILRFVCIFLISFVVGFVLSCEKGVDSKPTGKCIYGPPGYKVCINGTYKKECEEDFLNGRWYEGQKCD